MDSAMIFIMVSIMRNIMLNMSPIPSAAAVTGSDMAQMNTPMARLFLIAGKA